MIIWKAKRVYLLITAFAFISSVQVVNAGDKPWEGIKVRGVALCGKVVDAAKVLESQGFTGTYMVMAKNHGYFMSAKLRKGGLKSEVRVNSGHGANVNKTVHQVSASVRGGKAKSIFEQEIAQVEKATGKKIKCTEKRPGEKICHYKVGPQKSDAQRLNYYVRLLEPRGILKITAGVFNYPDC